MRVRATMAAGLAVIALVVAGCSSDGGILPGPEEPEPVPTWPLTGLPDYPDEHQTPVVVVKVDDSAASRPQLGIGEADLVVQEMVEGGTTRLAAMFHSTYPELVEPVRSVRVTDIGVVLPTGGTLAGSGGEQATIEAIEAAGIPLALEDFGIEEQGFSRDSARPIPYNLQLDVSTLVSTLPAARPPAAYLPFGEVPASASGSSASGLELVWPFGGASFEYDSNAGKWVRSDLGGAADFAFTNVIALSLEVRYDGGLDASGSQIPTMVTEGTGSGVVATAGEVHEVTWSKAAADQPWSFTFVPAASESASPDAEAAPSAPPEPFLVPPGRTWLALLPVDGGSVEVED